MRIIITISIILCFAAPACSLTVEEALQHALALNPDIQSLRLEEITAQGQLEKSRLILANNPIIEGNLAQKDRSTEEGGGAFTNYGVMLSQEFEIAGQRKARIDIAEKELARVKAEVEDKERILTAEVKNAFVKVLALRKKNELARQIVLLNGELLDFMKVKLQAGDVSILELNLSEVDLSKAKRELLLSKREYSESLLALQGLLGLMPDASLTIEGNLPSEAPSIPAKETLKEALAKRPDAKASGFEVEKSRSALNLAKKEVVPNITLSGRYEKDEGKNLAGMAISIPLPLFDRKQAEKKEAYVKNEAAKIKSDGLKKTIEREVEQGLNDLLAAVEELSLFNEEIIKKTEENLNLLNLAFKEGKVGFFEVRQAQRDTIETQFAYIEAQTRTQLALTAMEKAIGGPLKR
jgi:outer membrane protein, heavy metal efflux system